MSISRSKQSYINLNSILDSCDPKDWKDIVELLIRIKEKTKESIIPEGKDYRKTFSEGTAFITFAYGIDGVSIEMSKYAQTFENIFSPSGKASIHFIGGNFKPQVSSILDPEWKMFHLEGIDGWDKWDDGKWFDALYKRKMTSFSEESNLLTKKMYQQAVVIAKKLGKYFIENNITLVVPVNIASNPGNFALTLGLVMVTEIMGIYVLNSNHDFYWEAGRPTSEREPDEEPGVRDHFFHNIHNKTFFSLFEMLYPWDGSRWLQININARQSRMLRSIFGFASECVFEISTCISDSFFDDFDMQEIIDIRLRMGHILSNGEAFMKPVPIAKHLAGIESWMNNQKPVILGARDGLLVDPKSEDLILLLQPTRVVSRKRIENNFELIQALFQKTGLTEKFEKNLDCQLILHITGPTPREHQGDLEKVLHAYEETVHGLPESIADRIFIAFSVGRENHASFAENNFQPLTIESIYRMADVVVFPSETEGRGLPIIEASACGIPIICSQYFPREVFREVIGEKLPENLRIKYTLFPDKPFPQAFLTEAADLMMKTGDNKDFIDHNREAVRARYSHASFMDKFARILDQLHQLD